MRGSSLKSRLSMKLAGAAVVMLTGVGTVAMQAANASSKTAKKPNNPFIGTTIDLVSSGGAGSNHDLFARAVAPGLGSFLHAKVDVVDMPGGGQLLAWNYVNKAVPTGLVIGTIDVEGALANLWEKVPNNSVNPARVTWLGGYPGEGSAEVLYASNSAPQPAAAALKSIYTLIKDHTAPIKELGSVGDVPGPLFFALYHIPSTDLSSYGNASDQLAGIERGDGPVTVKSWGGGFATWATSGGGKVIFSFSMNQKWKAKPSIPTLYTLLKKDPPKTGAAALIADATALDAGTGIFGPGGLTKAETYWLSAAIHASINGSFYKTAMTNARIQLGYESPKSEQAAVKYGIQAKTIALLRKYLPLSTGIAS